MVCACPVACASLPTLRIRPNIDRGGGGPGAGGARAASRRVANLIFHDCQARPGWRKESESQSAPLAHSRWHPGWKKAPCCAKKLRAPLRPHGGRIRPPPGPPWLQGPAPPRARPARGWALRSAPAGGRSGRLSSSARFGALCAAVCSFAFRASVLLLGSVRSVLGSGRSVGSSRARASRAFCRAFCSFSAVVRSFPCSARRASGMHARTLARAHATSGRNTRGARAGGGGGGAACILHTRPCVRAKQRGRGGSALRTRPRRRAGASIPRTLNARRAIVRAGAVLFSSLRFSLCPGFGRGVLQFFKFISLFVVPGHIRIVLFFSSRGFSFCPAFSASPQCRARRGDNESKRARET